MIQKLRQFVISVLDDEEGINDAAYTHLQELEATIAPTSCDDIFYLVRSANGRYFLDEEHGLVP